MPGPAFPVEGAKSNKDNEATEQIYAINAPKIFLETLSARSTTIIFAVTYIAFIVGFGIDINAAYKGFTSSDVVLPGINSSPNSWNGTVKSLANVISVSLTVRQSNFTALDLVNQTASSTSYDATIWACYMAQGCGQNFDESGGFDGTNIWHQVLSSKKNIIYVPPKEESVTTTWELIPTTFQNQESIPARGKVRSYFFQIEYTQISSELFASTTADSNEVPTAFYTVNVLTRPGSSVTSGTFSVILLLVVCCTLVGFIYVMVKQKKKWLTEQKWVCYYLAALIIFINPIYCAIIWQQEVSPTLVFAFYFFDAMGQAAFFVVWLLFADSINRKAMSHLRFYLPKILIGFSIFVTSIVVLVYQFPSVSPANSTNSKRNPSQAVIDWSPELQYSFTAVSITVLLLMSIWVFYWLITLFLTGRQLNTLPYMNTRYLQLSYRFFLLQAYLLAAYFVFQYCFIIYLLLRETASGGVKNIVELTDYLNALSRQQTQLFGKVVFLAVYALVLAFLFLPASLVDSDLATTLASTYVLTEKEMKRVVRTRRLAISNVRHVLAGVVQKIVDAKAEVFCVETAITFCNISFEAYYDSLNLKTGAGYDTKEMDLKKYGYEMIDTIYRPDHETFCIIARHVSLNKLVVCFRGTSCKQHWSDNLNYSQRELMLPALTDLDSIDGLGDNIEIHEERERNATTTSELEMGPITPLSGSIDVEQPHTDDKIINIRQNTLSFHGANVELNREGSSKNSVSSTHRHVQPTLRDNWRRASVVHHTEVAPVIAPDDGLVFEDDDDDDDDDDVDVNAEHHNRNNAAHTKHAPPLKRYFSAWRAEDVREPEPLDGARPSHPWRDANEFISTGANTLGRGMNHVASTVVGATTNVVGGATDLVVGVAAITPGLKTLVRPQVHSGFWEAYAVVRDDLHAIVRRELKKHPAHLYCVGHSLGGALATLAALDCSIHTVPRVNAYLERVRDAHNRVHQHYPVGVGAQEGNISVPRRRSLLDTLRWTSVDHIGSKKLGCESPSRQGNTSETPTLPDSRHYNTHGDPAIVPEAHPGKKVKGVGVRRVKVTMYNYGSPRVGNGYFALLYNRIVPDSFRTVVDGDLVTSMPPTGYRHVGTQAVVDNLGAGSIIIDPSFIERRLRTHTKSSVSVHSLLVYRKGLTGVKDAAEFMKEQAVHFQIDTDKFDVVRLALQASHMARNNSFARHPATLLRAKKSMKFAKPSFSAIEALEEPDAPPESDHIPPSGTAKSRLAVSFAQMGVSSALPAAGIVPLSPIFEPLSEDSPVENEAPTRDWSKVSDSSALPDRNITEIGNDVTEFGEMKNDDSDRVRKDESDVDFQEAAHYANDLATAQSLVDGMYVSVVYPLESYVRAAMRTMENCKRPDLLWSNNDQHPVTDSGAELTSEL